jgi:hypothetical protein
VEMDVEPVVVSIASSASLEPQAASSIVARKTGTRRISMDCRVLSGTPELISPPRAYSGAHFRRSNAAGPHQALLRA